MGSKSPSKAKQVLHDVASNQCIIIEEDKGIVSNWEPQKDKMPLKAAPKGQTGGIKFSFSPE